MAILIKEVDTLPEACVGCEEDCGSCDTAQDRFSILDEPSTEWEKLMQKADAYIATIKE